MTDSQIIDEEFLENINNFLNTGEVANFYTKEDKDSIEEEMFLVLEQNRIIPSKDNMYRHFIDRLRDNFHIILCMSPIGTNLRQRCLKFPSLINCCTLIMFDRWPEIALNSVAANFLEEVSHRDLSATNKKALAKIFPKMYQSCVKAANAYLQEFGRNVYVTPKNFLDCINIYIDYLEDAKKIHDKKVRRLQTGMDNLKETNR